MKLAQCAGLHEPGTGAKPLPGFFICPTHLTMHAETKNCASLSGVKENRCNYSSARLALPPAVRSKRLELAISFQAT
jgi:hypothetical protein